MSPWLFVYMDGVLKVVEAKCFGMKSGNESGLRNEKSVLEERWLVTSAVAILWI